MSKFVYLEKNPNSAIFRCRGVLSAKDNFESFQQKMKKHNLDSFLSDEHLGREVSRTETDDGFEFTVTEV